MSTSKFILYLIIYPRSETSRLEALPPSGRKVHLVNVNTAHCPGLGVFTVVFCQTPNFNKTVEFVEQPDRMSNKAARQIQRLSVYLLAQNIANVD